ncbi:uncharacterized protein CLUP02_14932 [Colletotrichum lupini]|uniref:Uncharacterized protein n=1 Tax=Colletotrichum lupini TaxID=145971 RepID=A0A9Q8T5Q8_9PEZI|nr:uncharacterized protein CLUP02_14932 [Colletotrichum lupini]UQC89403.1 hypothetical protein CLUP02_14932 [Colletotrichum lupini]
MQCLTELGGDIADCIETCKQQPGTSRQAWSTLLTGHACFHYCMRESNTQYASLKRGLGDSIRHADRDLEKMEETETGNHATAHSSTAAAATAKASNNKKERKKRHYRDNLTNVPDQCLQFKAHLPASPPPLVQSASVISQQTPLPFNRVRPLLGTLIVPFARPSSVAQSVQQNAPPIQDMHAKKKNGKGLIHASGEPCFGGNLGNGVYFLVQDVNLARTKDRQVDAVPHVLYLALAFSFLRGKKGSCPPILAHAIDSSHEVQWLLLCPFPVFALCLSNGRWDFIFHVSPLSLGVALFQSLILTHQRLSSFDPNSNTTYRPKCVSVPLTTFRSNSTCEPHVPSSDCAPTGTVVFDFEGPAANVRRNVLRLSLGPSDSLQVQIAPSPHRSSYTSVDSCCQPTSAGYYVSSTSCSVAIAAVIQSIDITHHPHYPYAYMTQATSRRDPPQLNVAEPDRSIQTAFRQRPKGVVFYPAFLANAWPSLSSQYRRNRIIHFLVCVNQSLLQSNVGLSPVPSRLHMINWLSFGSLSHSTLLSPSCSGRGSMAMSTLLITLRGIDRLCASSRGTLQTRSGSRLKPPQGNEKSKHCDNEPFQPNRELFHSTRAWSPLPPPTFPRESRPAISLGTWKPTTPSTMDYRSTRDWLLFDKPSARLADAAVKVQQIALPAFLSKRAPQASKRLRDAFAAVRSWPLTSPLVCIHPAIDSLLSDMTNRLHLLRMASFVVGCPPHMPLCVASLILKDADSAAGGVTRGFDAISRSNSSTLLTRAEMRALAGRSEYVRLAVKTWRPCWAVFRGDRPQQHRRQPPYVSGFFYGKAFQAHHVVSDYAKIPLAFVFLCAKLASSLDCLSLAVAIFVFSVKEAKLCINEAVDSRMQARKSHPEAQSHSQHTNQMHVQNRYVVSRPTAACSLITNTRSVSGRPNLDHDCIVDAYACQSTGFAVIFGNRCGQFGGSALFPILEKVPEKENSRLSTKIRCSRLISRVVSAKCGKPWPWLPWEMKIPACPDEAGDGWSGESNFKNKVPLGEPSPINLQTTRSSSNVRRQGRCGKPHDDGDSTDRPGPLSGLDSPRRLLTRLVANSDFYSGATIGFVGQDAGRAPCPI